MITFSKLGNHGRLANQIFQLSTAISLALDNNDKYIFPPWEHEKDFNLHNCFSNNIRITRTYEEPFFHYQKIPWHSCEEVLDLPGFWQSEKYFKNHEGLIKSLFTPKVSYGIQWDTTSIHVRRGDYVNNAAYVQLGMDYYQRAMNEVKSKKYMIFSDDIGWCKKHFIGEQFIFAENNSPITDLALQIACENAIIANSSFSWWGAYLNKNPSKIVIAPNKWFGNLPHNTKDLIPDGWLKI